MKIVFVCLLVFAFSLSVSAQEVERKNPAKACSFMAIIVGLETKGWKQRYEQTYGCASPYLEIGKARDVGLKNNIAYYVTGNATTVNELKLSLNINQPSEASEALNELKTYSQILCKRSLGVVLPEDIGKKILSGQTGTWTVQGASVKVERENWPTGKGYSLKFIIR